MKTEYIFSPGQEARLHCIDETIDMLLREKAKIYESASVKYILNGEECAMVNRLMSHGNCLLENSYKRI
ncbi:hypothetical protein GKG47_11845 [Lactonifactor sp. BIOML-A3]|uniref:hypothetical protein n=1 Tax=unclassified Lactonifactor TaxID=2636670 RepID=UPI0012B05164|nr:MULTISPECIES: hypothetical protein [unclassified Lactonifactor]MSA01047.1 hypothetical protein [Lactonifactor sp. BIOML-A5]MSA10307.1 hypothetical protein [Lactonifactor sp. BIOML-A4]MSA13117.1 hypothetical protein [Lactonifactor sp. BIOML-A3]MSA19279.1 hypothetical protein [Lactonifactor sp. BIOML-A2]MSA38356.1 hypothetical protein [Lactonifactor sp. BIOML-A1]